jgi:amidase
MLPIADGSDLGGSLRNPAAFCNVVGFRPSPGRVPAPGRARGWNPLPVIGPMARTVSDAGLLLSVMAGPDARDPLSLLDDPAGFARGLSSDPSGLRIAWSADLGFLPVEAAVREVFGLAGTYFESLGCVVEEAAPDLQDAPEVFQVLRAHDFSVRFAEYCRQQPDKLKDTIHWNTAKGLDQSGSAVAQAEVNHLAIYQRMLTFFADHDFLVLPSTQVLPFDKDLDWVREIEGVVFDNYLQWMEICFVISLTACPVISIPCGFSANGLPVGLQIIGPPGQDLAVLKLAHAFETAAPFAQREPEIETVAG